MTPKKILQFSLGPIGNAALGFIILPAIAWYFSAENIGRLAMLTTVLSFSTLTFSFGLDQAYVREFHDVNDKEKLLKNSILPGFCLLTLVLIIISTQPDLLSIFLFDIESNFITYLVIVSIISTFIIRFLSLVLRMNEQGLAYSFSQLCPKITILSLLSLLFIFKCDNSFENLLLVNSVSIFFLLVFLLWIIRRDFLKIIYSKLDYNQIKSLVVFGFPLFLGGAAYWGLTAMDKVLLKNLSSLGELGLYSIASSFAAAATIIQSLFSTLWGPTVYKWASNGENLDKIQIVTRYVLLTIVSIFCLAGLFSPIIPMLLPHEYVEVQWIFVSCLGFPLLYTLSEATAVGINVTKKTKFSMFASIIACLINLAGNLLMIPIFGASGAAASTCIAFLFFFILRTEFSILVWRSFPRILLYSYSLLCVVGAVLSSLYGDSLGWVLNVYWLILLLSIYITLKNDVLVAWQSKLIYHK